ncbi:MAG: ABC transporter ATP-binding protein/permease [Clostridia bacterium]|nr:ABC transporter ATP-binding protein/permease [Clostridia bacterium]
MKTVKKENCALILKDIVKNYGEGDSSVRALKKVNIAFRKNEFVSILGPSGCGKTTLLNIIGGLDRYTSGDLIINGKSTKQYKDSDWDTYRNNSIGFVFQSYNLIPHQTVLSNVELALTLSGVSKTERRKRAIKALKEVGLSGQENKKPNQLSGGQMQRVAIARALINNPEIILADEPTGALDTETSIQVMDLLKKVAKKRLVIMVTHNPKLAKDYSTRIIKLLDGEKVGDNDPIDENAIVKASAKGEKKGKSSMKFSTAFALSLSNLRTKRGRTILTSIAGSIGIIGIALVLAVSTGFSTYINKLQADTLSVYPVTVSEATVDLEDFDKLLEGQNLTKFTEVKEIATRKMFSNLTGMLKSNNISEDYLKYVNDYVDEVNSNSDGWQVCVQKDYGFDVNDYIFANISFMGTEGIMPVDTFVKSLENSMKYLEDSDLGISTSFVRQYIPTMCEIPDSQELLASQYDLLYGEWATEKDQVLLVVDQYNAISDITLALLGFKSVENINIANTGVEVEFDDKDTFTFEEAMDRTFYFVDLDERYSPVGANTYLEKIYDNDSVPKTGKSFPIKISGIVRLKDGVQQGVLDTGIAYTSKLVKTILDNGKNSTIAKDFDNVEHIRVVNPLVNGTTFDYSARKLGCEEKISKLSFYSVDYNAKEQLKAHLDKWNEKEGLSEEDKVHYSDSTALLFSALNSIVDAVKIVLICFTSISLVVSSIMIGIITYVSVVERTKEIGVLRALGARKKDISRIFNAETFLIGLFAGMIGIGITYLLSIPINAIVGKFITGVGRLASLKFTHALGLVCISFILTLIAGIIPARIAAKKDPVVALRSE